MENQEELFSDRGLKAMIIPLFLEQLLVMLVGIADTLVIRYAGEAAVSGVSLVNQFNTDAASAEDDIQDWLKRQGY